MNAKSLSFSVSVGNEVSDAEWAVVFRHQEPDDLSAYRSMIAASGEIVRTAYRHMPQDEQAWTSKTGKEILLFAKKGSK